MEDMRPNSAKKKDILENVKKMAVFWDVAPCSLVEVYS
jgi:hypothetical protein